ncbi:uncharacterized protein LOC125875790 [Solanum stenotomum]|uniref:uncharacterized protein LOC125875790 n=1 Tax=Solanum stenotomum TaxID=172797 RepID=UPI0020D18EED|nr:uncharacterized protein LOC125875790 [Solanum stenotomum]
MEFYHIFGFLSILKESLQLIPRNGKLLALTCFLQILFSSILLSILNFELNFLFHDIILKTSILSTSIDDTFKLMEIIADIKEDFRIFLIIYVSILVSLSLISFLYTIATIILSSNINISLKEFVLKISNAFKYAFITRLYTNMLSIGYFFIVLFLLSAISISSSNIFLFSIGIFVGIISFIFFLYLSIVWILALVISVIEEDCYGIKAIEKAGRLIKGNRLNGFMLNILFSIISSLLYLCYLKINKPNKRVINQILMSIFLVIISSLFNLLLLVAYTVLYSHCKKNHGEEEVELDGSFEYSKV